MVFDGKQQPTTDSAGSDQHVVSQPHEGRKQLAAQPHAGQSHDWKQPASSRTTGSSRQAAARRAAIEPGY